MPELPNPCIDSTCSIGLGRKLMLIAKHSQDCLATALQQVQAKAAESFAASVCTWSVVTNLLCSSKPLGSQREARPGMTLIRNSHQEGATCGASQEPGVGICYEASSTRLREAPGRQARPRLFPEHVAIALLIIGAYASAAYHYFSI